MKKGGISLNYVRNEKIGTLECLASSKLCGKWLNRAKGLYQCCLQTKPFHNSAKATFSRETGQDLFIFPVGNYYLGVIKQENMETGELAERIIEFINELPVNRSQ